MAVNTAREPGGGLDVPPAWQRLDLDALRGVLLIVGDTNTGKTTFARYLYQQLASREAVAYLDGDPGQATLGPPSTMTLALGRTGASAFPPTGETRRWFIGSVSPRGHMLPTVIGAGRLAQAAQSAGARIIVYDTSGLIDPLRGGRTLKLAKIDLLRPTVLFAIQRDRELETLLIPLRLSRRVRVIDLRPSVAVQARSLAERQAHRAAQFARYFAGAQPLTVNWPRLAVFPSPQFQQHRLVAYEDAHGFALGLGIVLASDSRSRQCVLQSSLPSLDQVNALRLGDLLLDPVTYRDRPLGPAQS